MATITYAFDDIVFETTLNTTTAGVQQLPAGTDLAGGGLFTAWDNQGNITGRIFENSGIARTAEFTINTTTVGTQTDPEVAGLVNGRAVVVWTDQSAGSGNFEVRAQMVNPDGTLFGSEIFVSEQPGTSGTAGDQTRPDVTALPDGGWVVTWQDQDTSPTDNDVLAQIYNADGTYRPALGFSQGVIGIEGADNDTQPTVAATSSGFVVVYSEDVGANTQLHAERFTAAGALVGTELTLDSFGSINDQADAVGRPDGGFTVAYRDNGWQGAETDITVGNWAADGTFLNWSPANDLDPSTVGTPTPDGNQSDPAVDVLSNGFLAVSWTEDALSSVDRAIWSPADDPTNGTIGTFIANVPGAIMPTENQSAISGLAFGRIVLEGHDTATNDISGLIQDLVRTTIGDATNETLTGDSLRDEIFGRGGNDTIFGGPANDRLFGEGGNDLLLGESGDDVMSGGDGDDTLGGGSGNDTLNGDAGNDLLIGESGDDFIIGGIGNDRMAGGSGDDILGGQDGDDVLEGDSGNDLLVGEGGNDVIIGGLGNDRMGGQTGDDTLGGQDGDDLLQGDAGNDTLLGEAGTDLLIGGSGFDQMAGGPGDDTLGGGDDDDLLEGNDGADFLLGEAGRDRLIGGDGNDTLAGGSGDDEMDAGNGSDGLYGEDGNDLMIGGAGNDVQIGGAGNDTFRFFAGFGNDLIRDFAAGPGAGDLIQIDHTVGASDFASLLTHATQVGGDTVIQFDAFTSITLEHVEKANLAADDFSFF